MEDRYSRDEAGAAAFERHRSQGLYDDRPSRSEYEDAPSEQMCGECYAICGGDPAADSGYCWSCGERL